MNKIERILCPVDLSEASARACVYAQSLANHYDATLVFQHVVELWQHPCAFHAASAKLLDEFCQNLISAGREDLKQFVSRHTAVGLRPECIVQEGVAADGILSVAQADAIDLIVVGTHGRRGLDRLMLGSVAERVLRNAPCPVLVVRNVDHPEQEAIQIRQILCCVDFSKHSEQILEYALSVAGAYEAEVTALNVLDEIKNPAEIGSETATAMEKLQKLISTAAFHSVTAHIAVRLGNPNQQILEFASDAESDLIVTGVRGRHAVDLALFGSTTHRVIQRGCCPVLAVHVQEDLASTLEDQCTGTVGTYSPLPSA
jgi:nucleotide-binding universal stress UspA family protein